MPVTIGGEADNGFDRPIGLLKDCHRRMERFLGVFEALAALPAGARLEPGQQQSLQRAIDYFESAAQRHVADEEQSLFPRMRKYPQCAEVLREMEHLEDDHCRAHALHATCNTIGRFWMDLGTLPENQRLRFEASVHDMAELYRAHIAVEDQQVFPLAESVLSEEDKAGIGQEMADRRGLFATA